MQLLQQYFGWHDLTVSGWLQLSDQSWLPVPCNICDTLLLCMQQNSTLVVLSPWQTNLVI